MLKKLITKAELSRICKRTASTITRQAVRKFPEAVDGSKVDIGHPDLIAYVHECGAAVPPEYRHNGYVEPDFSNYVKPPAPGHPVAAPATKKKTKKKTPPATPPPPATGEDPATAEDYGSYMQMTLGEILARHGTTTQFKVLLDAAGKLQTLRGNILKNDVTAGLLVHKDSVYKGVIEPFEAAHLKLMKDGAKTITALVTERNAAGDERALIEGQVSDMIGKFIEPVKKRISKVLPNV